MEDNLKILFLSSEVSPFSRTAPFSDVACSLPKALKSIGHEVRLVTPRYKSIRERRYGLREVSRLRDMEISVGDKNFSCSVKSGFITGSKVQVYFLENPEHYEKPLPDSFFNGNNNPDEFTGYALLNHAALQLMMALKWIPDIIHCNNWQSALVPYLIKRNETYRDTYLNTRTVLHIHQLENLGMVSPEFVKDIGYEKGEINDDQTLLLNGEICFLKAGISTADKIVTVSPSFAEDICSVSNDEDGFNQAIEDRKCDILGVLNGVDGDHWNPENDRSIQVRYTINDVTEGKAANKRILLQKLNMPFSEDIPLIAMVNRLVEGHGLELLIEQEEALMSLPVRFVFLGLGEPKYESFLQTLAEKYPDKVSITFDTNVKLEHQIIAGADILLMPSICEPCGYHQMYGLLYGTVPVVRNTGGLADTVIDIDKSEENANGFTFGNATGDDMMIALNRALNCFQQKDMWLKLQIKGMESDFNWKDVAKVYYNLYKDALSKPPYGE
ncbi:glycogen synthase [bacterium]|nr:glycogen synthase [bacterium]